MIQYQKYDICLANVQYEDVQGAKIRPVLVIKDTVYTIECLKMTGHTPRSEEEYLIKEWRAAGLNKETTVRVSKRLSLQHVHVIKKIGHLQPVDIIEIQKRIT